MSTNLKIDFNRFAKKNVKTGGALSGDEMHELLSEDIALNDLLALVAPGKLIYWVSDDNWSMHELLLGLINITSSADVYISSYALGETQARILAQLKNSGKIMSLHCVLDNRVNVNTTGSIQLLKGICDSLVFTDTHAKVTVLLNEQWSISVIGSANYTRNRRFESGVISTSASAADMQIRWMKKAIQDEMG